jgi:hypothetical protein
MDQAFRRNSGLAARPKVQPVRPSAALVMSIEFSPVFVSESIDDELPEKELEQLRAIVNCIALVGECTTPTIMVFYENDDPRLPLISSGVTFTDPDWGTKAVTAHSIDAQRVRAVLTSYKSFAGDRRPLDMAMTRLSDARGGWHREERAIDLGISLEAMLMYEPGRRAGDTAEISYKLRSRAARLVGEILPCGEMYSGRLANSMITGRRRRIQAVSEQSLKPGARSTKRSTPALRWRPICC